MDEGTASMVSEAYHETATEALSQGNSPEIAHREAITAAAMFLAAMTGIEDSAARAQVEAMGLAIES